MKAIIVLIFSSILFSCTKNTTGSVTASGIYNSQKVDNVSLAGIWILINKSGGIAGTTTVPSDNISISFDSTGNYLKASNEAIIEAGAFSIGLEKTIYNTAKVPVINFSTTGKNYFNAVILGKDSLSLSDNFYDGFTYLYIKQK